MSTELERIAKPAVSTEFLKLYNRLCVAFREAPDETGVTQDVYFSALSDMPLLALAKGVDSLLRSDCHFFPKVTEWRVAAEKAYRIEFERAVQPSRDEPWQYECEACEDTGWNRYHCKGDNRCGWKRKHDPHDYASACPCRPTNRTYQRHNTFGRSANE